MILKLKFERNLGRNLKFGNNNDFYSFAVGLREKDEQIQVTTFLYVGEPQPQQIF